MYSKQIAKWLKLSNQERQRLKKWIKKNINYRLFIDTSFRSQNINRLKEEKGIKILHANSNQKRARVALLQSDKINF